MNMCLHEDIFFIYIHDSVYSLICLWMIIYLLIYNIGMEMLGINCHEYSVLYSVHQPPNAGERALFFSQIHVYTKVSKEISNF